MTTQKQADSSPVAERVQMTVLLAIAMLAVSTATFNHVGAFSWKAFATLQMMVITSVIAPLWISLLLSHESARLLFLIASRFLGFLLSLGLAQQWEGDLKKCLVLGLLACYFVALVLESGLLIRGLQRQTQPPRKS